MQGEGPNYPLQIWNNGGRSPKSAVAALADAGRRPKLALADLGANGGRSSKSVTKSFETPRKTINKKLKNQQTQKLANSCLFFWIQSYLASPVFYNYWTSHQNWRFTTIGHQLSTLFQSIT
jgi:hypothetical protein